MRTSSQNMVKTYFNYFYLFSKDYLKKVIIEISKIKHFIKNIKK